jgi:hypothetical protein
MFEAAMLGGDTFGTEMSGVFLITGNGVGNEGELPVIRVEDGISATAC